MFGAHRRRLPSPKPLRFLSNSEVAFSLYSQGIIQYI
jgi:hypothetical protein